MFVLRIVVLQVINKLGADTDTCRHTDFLDKDKFKKPCAFGIKIQIVNMSL